MRFVRLMAIALIAALSVALAFSVATGAQEKKPPKKEVVTIDGDKWKWQSGAYTITGNVVVKQVDATVTADRADYDEKARTVVLDGNLKIVDDRNEITGSKATVYLNDKKSIVDGNVRVVLKPKQDAAPKNSESVTAKLKEPSVITCDKMEYLYGKKTATFDGNFKLTQKSRVLVGNRANYDVNQELVILTGGVKVTDDEGQSFASPGTVRASLREGAEWIEAEKGSATLNVNIEGETEKASEKE